ncbi:PREDICTED: serine/threonine-protein phosphatase with EF-hands 2 [Hipposideros armiger]|uniref:Serine/threonine-protein phosphatase with EF-hands n=1 Tax=Hipposideros armiger TaxID=186990 RepID=A0A8B7PS67_HIPAR|nr:PREDICTED: serine/threonine-protein phosphatase with EF-hands 2 [Hipposideros armiger]
MGSGTSTHHQFAFQNAEKAFKAAALIQRWYRRHMARLETRRQCTWSIFQSIEYAGQQDQAKLHDFFSYLVDHFTPSSHSERDFLNRISRDSDMDKYSDYESIEVPDNYTGPRLSFPLLPDHATALVEAFRLKQHLHARYVLNLLHETRKHLVQLPNINQVSMCYSEEITVCGDLHGQLDDLIFIFYKNGLPSPERAYVFNGDFVDRGKDSVEILMILFAFLLVYPKEFHLNRGNHEDHMVNLRYGFTKEVMHKYKKHGKKILKILQDVFCWLPLATLIDEKVLILHGGVSDMTDLELLSKLDRNKIVSTLRCKTRKENEKQAEEKGKANQASKAGKPSPWFLPPSPLRVSTHKAHKAGCSSSVPCSSPLHPRGDSRQVRSSVDLGLERCPQHAGFPVIKEEEEPWLFTSEADSEAGELPEPTQEEWRQVGVARCCSLEFGCHQEVSGILKTRSNLLLPCNFCPSVCLYLGLSHPRKIFIFAVLTIFSASNYYEVGSNKGAYVKLGPALTPHIVQYQANKATHMLTMRQRQDLSMNDFQKNRIIVFIEPLKYQMLYVYPNSKGTLIQNPFTFGFISLDEFRQTWKLFSSHMKIDITDDCIRDLARSIDFNKDGHIDINEFLEAFRLVEQSCSEGNASDCPQATNTNGSGSSRPGTH